VGYRRDHSEAQNCRSLLAIARDQLGPDDAIDWVQAHHLKQHPGWGDDEIADRVEVLLEDAEQLPDFSGRATAPIKDAPMPPTYPSLQSPKPFL
jgi:hypothetical protein